MVSKRKRHCCNPLRWLRHHSATCHQHVCRSHHSAKCFPVLPKPPALNPNYAGTNVGQAFQPDSPGRVRLESLTYVSFFRAKVEDGSGEEGGQEQMQYGPL